LDGATGFKELWYIVLPLTYPTMSVFLITGVATIFVNQFNVHQMFQGGAPAELRNIGYWFFVDVAGKFKNLQSVDGAAELPYYAAIGVILTFITIPIALTVRWALEKYGPSEE
jgi:ABC-type sugar transport system permease subunit